MDSLSREYNKKTPSKKSYGSNDPPPPITSSDENDNEQPLPMYNIINNNNNNVNAVSPSPSPSPSIDSMRDTVESGLHAIHSLSYSMRQYSTTTTTAITKHSSISYPYCYDLSFNDNDYDSNCKLIQIDEKSEAEQSEKSTLLSLHCKPQKYGSDVDLDVNGLNGKGYKTITWRDWQKISKNRFCCNGRIMFGSDFGCFIVTNLCICIPSILQWLFVFSHIESPYLCLISISYVLFCLCLILLYLSSFTEAGFLPRGYEQIPPIDAQIKANGSRFCVTCKIWRPPRAKHCRFCNCCVRKYDHHCNFIGSCIGERNEHYFSLFVFVISLYSFYCMVITLDVLVIKFTQIHLFWQTIKLRPLAFGLMICSFLVCTWLVPLSWYRCHLICNQETQNENLKRTFKMDGNPYDKGCFINCKDVYCGKKAKSQISR